MTALLVGLVLWALGLHMAWLFAFLVFLLCYIPNIGSIIATLLPIPVAVTQFSDNPAMIVAAVVIPGTIHLTIGNLVAPKLEGRGLELHPVTVLLALAFWGLLWGIVGMVLAIPAAQVLRGLVYGVSPRDPRVFAFVVVLLAVVALVATFIPARRATRVDPRISMAAE